MGVLPTRNAHDIMHGGKVPEWTIGAVSKTAAGLAPPWVRIPPFPPVVNGEVA